MTVQPIFPRRWLARASMVCTLILAAWVGAGSGCSSSPAGTGASGTGATGSTSSTTTSSSSTTTTTTGNPMSSTGALSGPTGTGGMSGTGGMGGMGGAATGGAGGSPCATLTGSADYPPEMEPNNLDSQANQLQANTKGFTAAICPLGDVDIFSFTVTASGSSATIATSDGMGGCPAGAHTLVRVYDGAGNILALDTGANGCVSLTPTSNVALGTLAPGMYYVHIESATLATIPTYTLDIAVTTPGCGDGIVQVGSGEQCDDGPTNGMAGDVCSATCQLTNGKYRDEIEPDDTLAETMNSLDGYAGAVGELYPANDVDSYYVDVLVAGSSITATISDGKGGCSNNFDSILTLYSPTKALLVTDKGGGVMPCSKINPQVYPAAANLPVGRYYLQVARQTTVVMPYYVLDVKVTPPSCGDHIVPEGTKQCDPVTPNPGCSATCQLTGDFIPETEPNGTFATANPLTDGKGTHAGFIGAISPVGDQDYFSFTVTNPNSLVVISTGDGMGGCPTGFTSSISLYTSSHQLLAQDTRSGVGTCSLISPNVYAAAKNLAAGTYYVAVNQAGNNMTQWEYVLSINVYTPGCGDDYIENGEQCDDGPANGMTGDGCDNTCQSIAPWEKEPNGGIGTANTPYSAFSPPVSPITTWKGEIKPVERRRLLHVHAHDREHRDDRHARRGQPDLLQLGYEDLPLQQPRPKHRGQRRRRSGARRPERQGQVLPAPAALGPAAHAPAGRVLRDGGASRQRHQHQQDDPQLPARRHRAVGVRPGGPRPPAPTQPPLLQRPVALGLTHWVVDGRPSLVAAHRTAGSAYRMATSVYRTVRSAHRTATCAHRTAGSVYRTARSAHRTATSAHLTAGSVYRTAP